jgi:AcrR family transcriptional regulator
MPRVYRSEQRELRADQTRRTILCAAGELFESRSYAATTMRQIAARAGVALPTVEAVFGTKPRLLKAAIDVAIAGDNEPVSMLERPWAAQALEADSPGDLLVIAVQILGPAQQRSSGLVLAALEASASDPELAVVAAELVAQRRRTATWLVDALAARATLRDSRELAIDTLWVLMDPAVFHRVVHRLGWDVARYQEWFARCAQRLLIPDKPEVPDTAIAQEAP